MTDETELTGDEADYWYGHLRDSVGLNRLFEESDVDVPRDVFERSGVYENQGVVAVTLYHEESEGEYVRVTGVFDERTGETERVELDDGHVSAPLCGHGLVWEYRDGDVTTSRWIA